MKNSRPAGLIGGIRIEDGGRLPDHSVRLRHLRHRVVVDRLGRIRREPGRTQPGHEQASAAIHEILDGHNLRRREIAPRIPDDKHRACREQG